MGYDEAFGNKKQDNDIFGDNGLAWTYGGAKNSSTIKSYKIDTKEPVVAASSISKKIPFGRTAESFLSNLGKKSTSNNVDLSEYGEGVRVYHKKFGEGTITATAPEGDDLKVDISFDKVGHKRLMAKFANLEII